MSQAQPRGGHPTTGFGPYRDERQAAVDARDVLSIPAGPGVRKAANVEKLRDACAAAGVGLGDYDQRVVDWLGGWEPEVVQVVAGLIRRAGEASAEFGQETDR